MLADYHPSVAKVYSLLRESPLAFLWTHGCTFYVRPFPSEYLSTPLDRGSAHGRRQPRASRG
jgi:hypothetical protein